VANDDRADDPVEQAGALRPEPSIGLEFVERRYRPDLTMTTGSGSQWLPVATTKVVDVASAMAGQNAGDSSLVVVVGVDAHDQPPG